MKENENIVYGDVDATEDLKQPAIIRTSLFLDLELKEKLKEEAKVKGIKYQQLVREILRDHINNVEIKAETYE